MRARLDDLVLGRLAEDGAVPALTCYDFITASGVVAAAELFGRGVILLVTPKTAASRDGLRLTAALRQLADAAAVPVVVQLDHATDMDLILRAVEAGADAVLADGSARSFEENVAFVTEVGLRTAAHGVVIEAELGGLAGDEDRAFEVEVGAKTDPAQVAQFVAASGARLLATSIGNVHGRYKGTPALDWPLIEAIRAESSVPLTLHGASGLPESDLARAPQAGLGKVNINTELRAAILDATGAQLPRSRADGDDVFTLERVWRDAATAFALSALARLDATARPGSDPS